MKSTLQRVRRGFTLIELSIAMMMGIATGAMVLALCNQQLAFLKMYKAQNFLTDEAPIINMYVSRLIGKADRFRLHDSVADALSGANPRLTDSPVVVLNFRQPDGTMRAAILSFENRVAGPALYYYVVPLPPAVMGDPQWAVTKAPSNVVFSMSEGVLRMTITGPKRERITYSGTMQQ
jgi:prepilin-type N-terminal cleavage/methylation domain-containing protein